MLCVVCMTTSIIVVTDIGTHNTTHTTIISLGHKMAKSKGRHRNSWHAMWWEAELFFFWEEWGKGGVGFFMFSMCSQVPNVFPNIEQLTLSHICFAQYCPPGNLDSWANIGISVILCLLDEYFYIWESPTIQILFKWCQLKRHVWTK
jgi:hypothetical protein